MADERSTTINIGGREYELLLTTGATKEIAAKYGGLDKLGEKLTTTDNIEVSLSEVVWLITVLANQAIKRHNMLNNDDRKELLSEEFIELFTEPADLIGFKSAIYEAMMHGMKRNILSENDRKNSEAE